MDITQIFNSDLTNVDVSRPLLKPGPVPFIIGDCKVDVVKSNEARQKLVLTLKTEFEQKSTKGDSVNAGFTLTHSVGITPSDDYPAERIMQELKKVMVGVGRTGAFGDPASYIGERITANVYVEKDPTGKYADQNRISSFIKR